MYNLCTISDLTVDKPWNDLSRAWDDLSRVWTEAPKFSTIPIFFCYSKVLNPPKNVQQFGFYSGYSCWHKYSKTYTVLRLLYGPDSGLLLLGFYRFLDKAYS